jgi:hypothetical protein
LETLEEAAVTHLKDAGEADAAGLGKALNISEESAAHLIAHMTSGGKVRSQVRAYEKSKQQQASKENRHARRLANDALVGVRS